MVDKEAIKATLGFGMLVIGALPALALALIGAAHAIGLLFRGIGLAREQVRKKEYERYRAGDPRDSIFYEVRNQLLGQLMSLKPGGLDTLLANLRLRESLAIDFTVGDWDPRWLIISFYYPPETDGQRPVQIQLIFRNKELFKGVADLNAIPADQRW
jgi:hypothetical protein